MKKKTLKNIYKGVPLSSTVNWFFAPQFFGEGTNPNIEIVNDKYSELINLLLIPIN